MPKRKKKWIGKALGTKRRRKGYRAAPGHRHRKSVRVEAAHKGALHRYLGIPEGQPIPAKFLVAAKRNLERALHDEDFSRFIDAGPHHVVLRHLRQVNFALTARKFKHGKRKTSYRGRR